MLFRIDTSANTSNVTAGRQGSELQKWGHLTKKKAYTSLGTWELQQEFISGSSRTHNQVYFQFNEIAY